MADVMSEDRIFWPLLLEVASCLCQQIQTLGLPEPCFCGVVAGAEVAHDHCDGCASGRCGQAWARITEVYASTAFPELAFGATCTSPLAATIEIGILRCAPVFDAQGTPPGIGEHLEVTRLVAADMNAMRRTWACCAGHREHVIGAYTPVGPLGGCVGGTWLATFSEQF